MPLKPSCLIIGAGDGVGSAIARAFAREGLAVCITRRPRNLEALKAVAASIRADGGEAMPSVSMRAMRPK
jgi:NAD(P)-dependent dehydrogenase (short-subunit alcohol dehydrogenase family)